MEVRFQHFLSESSVICVGNLLIDSEYSEICSILLLKPSCETIFVYQLLFSLVCMTSGNDPFSIYYQSNLNTSIQLILYQFLRTYQFTTESGLLFDLALLVLLNHWNRSNELIGRSFWIP